MNTYQNQIEYWVDLKTGKPRNEFEKLYAEHDDPWGCTDSFSSFNNKILLASLDDLNPSSVLDVGCGKGDLTNQISCLNSVKKVDAFDASQTAVSKAKNRYKDINFFHTRSISEIKTGPYDAISIIEVLWYVADNIDSFLGTCGELLTEKGSIVIKNYFPDNQRFFNEFIGGVSGFIDIVTRNNLHIYRKITLRSQDMDDGKVCIFILKKDVK